MADFVWTAQRTQAAQLLADGELTSEAIAEQLGVSSRTLRAWKHDPEFIARIKAHQEDFRLEVSRRGLADRMRRVSALNDRWIRLQRVIAARAESPEMQKIAGGKTGLLVRTVKKIGAGESAELVEEFAVDVGLLKELREHEKQAAQELGQWTEKKEIGGTDGGHRPISIIEVVRPTTLEEAATQLRNWRQEQLDELHSQSDRPSGSGEISTNLYS